LLVFPRVEHDESADGVEGDSEGPERVATEQDGRALLRALKKICRHSAKHQRADADRGRAHATRRDFAARDVARARALPSVRREEAERACGALVNGEAETGACVEQRTSALGEHNEGASAATIGQPGHDGPARRGVCGAQGPRAWVEETYLAVRQVNDETEWVENFGRVEYAVNV